MSQNRSNVIPRAVLASIAALHVVVAVIGINWGLPTRRIDTFLFGDGPVWSGEKIARLANASDKWSRTRGADVDADARPAGDEPLDLTATEEQVAAIYLRYRLYTHQPDEMITMMALAGMRPSEGDFDPRLYQYGGLFIYPVGALIKLCGIAGLIDVRSDLTFYLDHPDEFGKFYIVARAYVAAWGLVGLFVVFLVTHRLSNWKAGALAALLYSVLPIVVCMEHEAKPHLPGAVLMLLAVLAAMRYVATGRRRDWWWLCLTCGAALGMVLYCLPIFVLVPLAAWMRAGGLGKLVGPRRKGTSAGQPTLAHGNRATTDESDTPPGDATTAPLWWWRALVGLAAATGVYLVTNPYVVINAFVNREVLASNFGNSLAMYEIARLHHGLWRVIELTAEGATGSVLLVGSVGFVLALTRRRWQVLPLAVPAFLLFIQFALLGAGKPAEYARFGIFPDVALLIAASCTLVRRWTPLREPVNWIPASLVAIWVGYFGYAYEVNFYRDSTPDNSREQFAGALARFNSMHPQPDDRSVVSLPAAPAPYSCPPIRFEHYRVLLNPDRSAWRASADAVLNRPRADRPSLSNLNPPTNRAGLLIVSGDRPSAGTPNARDLSFFAFEWYCGDPPYSPASWANKPFRVINPARRYFDRWRGASDR